MTFKRTLKALESLQKYNRKTFELFGTWFLPEALSQLELDQRLVLSHEFLVKLPTFWNSNFTKFSMRFHNAFLNWLDHRKQLQKLSKHA
jgi:hypothetical protein